MAHLVIGARNDALAVRQASFIKAQIERAQPGLQVGIELLADGDSTDWLDEASLALMSRRIDAVVHHLAELSPRLPEDLHLAAIAERTEARDALLVSTALRESVHSLADLPAQARVFAPGEHRRAQIAALHPEVAFFDHEVSLERALQRLAANACDAIVADGLSLLLLSVSTPVTEWLDVSEFIPAAGQGVLVVQSRLEDHRTNLILESLNHTPTRYAANAERAALRNLYGEPGDAIAVTATYANSEGTSQLTLTGLVADATATPVKIVRATATGDALAPDLLGSSLAMKLLNAGARELLAYTRTNQAVSAQIEELDQLYPMSFASNLTATISTAALPVVATANPSEPGRTSDLLKPQLGVFHETAAPEFDLVASKVQKLRQHQPLHGRNILLASTRKQDELTRQLEGLGASVATLPRLRATDPESWEPLDKVLLHVSWYDWLVFANAASVTACLNRCAALGHHLQEIEARRLCAIGKAAANSLRSAGLSPDLVLPQFDAATLASEWEARFGQHETLRGKTMLWLTAQSQADQFTQTTRSSLRTAFDQAGVYVEAVATHQYALKEWAGEWQTTYDDALFFDPSGFETLATLIAPRRVRDVLATSRVVCLSQESYKTAHTHGLSAAVRLTQSHPPALVKWLRELRTI